MNKDNKTQKSLKLSPSSINLMLECPRCFWLEKHKVWKRPESIFPSLPGGMDIILKKHFDKFMERGELPPEIREYGIGNGYNLFNDKAKLEIWRNNRKGIQYKDKTSGILLMGAIDNLLTKKGKLVVLDYKTRGYPLKEDTHEHYQAQMDMYNFLLRQNAYDTEDYAYLLFYYPKEVLETGELIFETKLIKMKTNAKKGGEYFEDAIKLLKGDYCPSASKDDKGNVCEWCEGV